MTKPANTSPLIIPSPCQQDLRLVLFPTREGIGSQGVTTYEGVMSYCDFANHFDVEADCSLLDESLKKQRDVTDSRRNKLLSYFKTRTDTVLPGVTLFVSDLAVETCHTIGGREIVEAVLPANIDRFTSDGQGRLTTIKQLLPTHPHYGDHEIAFKLVVTHSPSVDDKASVVKQLFADYHGNVTTPNSSQSLFFDGANAYSRLLTALLAIEIDGRPLRRLIALNGKNKEGQLWTYTQFGDLIKTFLGASANELDKLLSVDEEAFTHSFDTCRNFISALFAQLPLLVLKNDWKANHAQALFSKALCAKGFGWLGRSMVEEGLVNGEINWAVLGQLADLPLTDMTHERWLKAGITYQDEVRGKPVVKMMKGSDKRIGRALCQSLRVFPVEEL